MVTPSRLSQDLFKGCEHYKQLEQQQVGPWPQRNLNFLHALLSPPGPVPLSHKSADEEISNSDILLDDDSLEEACRLQGPPLVLDQLGGEGRHQLIGTLHACTNATKHNQQSQHKSSESTELLQLPSILVHWFCPDQGQEATLTDASGREARMNRRMSKIVCVWLNLAT